MRKKRGDDLTGLWRRWREHREEEARDELFHRHLYLTWQTVNRHWDRLSGYLDRDDAEQEAQLALLRALSTYQPQYGTQFVTWAITCIQGALFSQAKKEKRRRELAGIVPLEEGWDLVELIPDLDEGPEAQALSRYEQEAIDRGLEVLEEFERLALEAIFYGDLNLKETAEAFGKSAAEMQKARNRALKRMKKWLEGEG